MRFFYFLSILCIPFFAFSGVVLEKSRIVFNGKNTVQSYVLVNTNKYPVVVQLWVDDGKFNKNPELTPSPFVITPVMSKMDPKKINSIKVIYSGSNITLPQDHESLFWLNIFEVPPVNKNSTSENEVALSMLTQVKLIYRPEQIKIDENDLIAKFDSLTFRLIKNNEGVTTLAINNPAEYIASLVNIDLRGFENNKPVSFKLNELKSMTILPKNTEAVSVGIINPSDITEISYWLIDDQGRYVNKIKKLTLSK